MTTPTPKGTDRTGPERTAEHAERKKNPATETLASRGLTQLRLARTHERNETISRLSQTPTSDNVDWYEFSKHQRELEKREQYGRKGMIMHIACDSIWDEVKRYRAGYRTSPLCPYCNREEGDRGHLSWKCPVINGLDIPEIQDTNGLINTAVRETQYACYWIRGFIPADWTTPIDAPEGSYSLYQHKGNTTNHRYKYYTDGSGRKYHDDPRIRRCGSAGASISFDTTPPTIADAIWGSLPGDHQTVPRAELYAIIIVIENRPGPMTIYSDSKYAVDNYHTYLHKGLRAIKSNVDLWRRFHTAYQAMRINTTDTTPLTILKVKGHTTARDLINGVTTWGHIFGNDSVDTLARHGADNHEVSPDAARQIKELENQAHRVRKRLSAIYEWCANQKVADDRKCSPTILGPHQRGAEFNLRVRINRASLKIAGSPHNIRVEGGRYRRITCRTFCTPLATGVPSKYQDFDYAARHIHIDPG